MNVKNFLGINSFDEIFPKKLKKTYIMLDRKYVRETNNNTFSWDLSNKLFGDSIIHHNEPIKNIKYIKIYDYILNFGQDNYNKILTFAYNQIQNVSIHIKELSEQSIRTYFEPYHFIGHGSIDSMYQQSFNLFFVKHSNKEKKITNNATDYKNIFSERNSQKNDTFYFEPKITHLSSITISFAANNRLLTLNPYKYKCVITIQDIQSDFVYLSAQLTQTPIFNHPAQRSKVIIENFTTTEPEKDNKIINFINKHNMFECVAHNTTNNTLLLYSTNYVEISLLDTVTFFGIPQECDIYLEINRFIIPLEITHS